MHSTFRHNHYSKSYKVKQLNKVGLWFQSVNPLSSWWDPWQWEGRHDTREGSQSSTFWSTGNIRRLYTTQGVAWIYETSKSAYTMPHFLQKYHTYSNNVTSSSSSTLYGQNIQTNEYMGPYLFKLPPFQLWHSQAYRYNIMLNSFN